MESLQHLMSPEWIVTFGYCGLLLVIFLETGLFGFFFPGDSLVFTAGLLAAKGIFQIEILVPLLIVTTTVAYFVSYWIGARLKHWLEKRDRWWFKQRYIEKAHHFYQSYGNKALLFGRLVPVVRTFVPVAAGIAEMNLAHFFIFNFLGALLWGGGITLFGYWMGNIIPQSEKMILPITVLIIFVSLLPMLFKWLKGFYYPCR